MHIYILHITSLWNDDLPHREKESWCNGESTNEFDSIDSKSEVQDVIRFSSRTKLVFNHVSLFILYLFTVHMFESRNYDLSTIWSFNLMLLVSNVILCVINKCLMYKSEHFTIWTYMTFDLGMRNEIMFHIRSTKRYMKFLRSWSILVSRRWIFIISINFNLFSISLHIHFYAKI